MEAETRALWCDYAGLIKSELWLGKDPPPSPDTKPWTMGREHSVFKQLLKGWSAEELVGALSVIQTVNPYDKPRRGTVFYGTRVDPKDRARIIWTGTPMLERCVSYWISGKRAEKRVRSKDPGRVRIELG